MSTITGQKRLVSRIKRIRNGLPPVLDDESAKQLLIRRIRARFIAEVSPDGTPWAPLAAKTVANKKRKGRGAPEKKLIDSRSLYRAFGEISSSAGGLLAFSTGAGFRIGVDDPEVAEYGRIQNYGNSRIPARPFIGLSPQDVESYVRAIRRKLNRLVEG
jgi:hypothetical protein